MRYNNDIEMGQQQPSSSEDKDTDETKVARANNDSNSGGLIDYMWVELKDSIIFAVLFVVFNLPIVVYVLSKYVPWMINYETGAATYTGLMIRGILAGLLYWLVRHFVVVA